MKTKQSLLAGTLLAACAVAFAACTKDKTAQDEYGASIRFTTGITTRATAQQWEQDDRIGIFMIAQGAGLSAQTIVDNADNKQYSASEGASATLTPVSDDDRIYFPRSGDKVDFIAYHPYLPSADINGYTIAVNTAAQSAATAVDLLYSDDAAGMDLNDEQVAMTFRHVMCKLDVNIRLATEFAGAVVESVSFTGFASTGVFSLSDGQWTAGQIGIVSSYRGGNNFTAHMIPQGTAAGRFIAFIIDGKTYTYPIDNGRVLPQGKILTYNLIAGREGVLEAYVTISDWIGNKVEDQSLILQSAQIGIDWAGYNDADFTAIEILGGDGNTYTSPVTPNGGVAAMITTGLVAEEITGLVPQRVWVYYMGQKFEVPEKHFSLSDDNILTIDYHDIVAKRTHLEYINTNEQTLAGNYFQICDIDLAGNDWTPIGTNLMPFSGIYDGGGYRIENLNINLPETDYVGLYGFCQSGTLTNIHIASGSIGGRFNVGGICGRNSKNRAGESKIETCINSASVRGSAYVGGICGYNYVNGVDSKVTIISCINHGDIFVYRNSAGGICGENNTYGASQAIIENCVNTGMIIGTSYFGGICGKNYANGSIAIITCCSNVGTVAGTKGYNRVYIGGVCGENYADNSGDATIIECYSAALVRGSNYVGGVCGGNRNGGTIQYCFWGKGSDQNESPTTDVGFIIGDNVEFNYQFGADDGNQGIHWPGITPIDGYWELYPNGRWATLGAWGGSPESSTYPQLAR